MTRKGGLKIRYFRNLRVTTKFILWFLVVALVPLAVATYVSYSQARRVLEEEVTKSLRAIADNKANQIISYLNKKEKDATTLSYTPEIIETLDKFTAVFRRDGVDSSAYRDVDQEYRPFLSYYQKSFDYENVFLVDPDGKVLFSTSAGAAGPLHNLKFRRGSQPAKAVAGAGSSMKTEVSGFEYYPGTGMASAFIAAPVLSGANTIGIIVAEMSNKGLSELVRDYTGLGETGETVIVSEAYGKNVAITPLRFDPDAAFKREIKTERSERSTGLSTDYRGRRVLAVWRYLSAFRIGILVKMDIDEVFASAGRLRDTLYRISLILLAAAVAAAVLIARSVSSPITELTRISSTITNGDLSARAKIHAADEIGELAHSFNRMTDSLVRAKNNVEEKKAELEVQKKLLEEANKELDSFVYTASHDLRAPLRGIDAFAGFLEQDYTALLDEKGKDYLRRICAGTKRMKDLIDDLLTLSRISRIKNPYEYVDISGLLEEVIARIEFDIRKLNVELSVHSGMPVVWCDRIKLGEVFLNLINNAIKFSSGKKGTVPKVEVGYADRDTVHEFYVKDNGIGIDEKYHNEIFGIFRRLHKQDEYEGTGAGLSIVKRIIEDHKGSIRIDSEPGRGATFYFTISKDLHKRPPDPNPR